MVIKSLAIFQNIHLACYINGSVRMVIFDNVIMKYSKYNLISILIPLLLLLSYKTLAQQKELTVLSYNVLKGFQGDSLVKEKYLKWLSEKKPDIIIYEEMNGFTQKTLEEFAIRYGHPYAVIAKETGYSVAITSKFPIKNPEKVLENMWHGYLYANINGINVFAVHLSPFVYQKRYEEVQQIQAHAAVFGKDAPVLIAGDFNSYQARDSSLYTQIIGGSHTPGKIIARDP